MLDLGAEPPAAGAEPDPAASRLVDSGRPAIGPGEGALGVYRWSKRLPTRPARWRRAPKPPRLRSLTRPWRLTRGLSPRTPPRSSGPARSGTRLASCRGARHPDLLRGRRHARPGPTQAAGSGGARPPRCCCAPPSCGARRRRGRLRASASTARSRSTRPCCTCSRRTSAIQVDAEELEELSLHGRHRPAALVYERLDKETSGRVRGFTIGAAVRARHVLLCEAADGHRPAMPPPP